MSNTKKSLDFHEKQLALLQQEKDELDSIMRDERGWIDKRTEELQRQRVAYQELAAKEAVGNIDTQQTAEDGSREQLQKLLQSMGYEPESITKALPNLVRKPPVESGARDDLMGEEPNDGKLVDDDDDTEACLAELNKIKQETDGRSQFFASEACKGKGRRPES